jgi:LacI family transcriptional regulator
MKADQRIRKKATMFDVARRAGASISSVSRVINDYPGVHPELVSRVQKAIAELNYLPGSRKRRLQESCKRVIYFILTNRALHIPFHSKVLQAIENLCSQKEDLLLFRTFRYTPQTLPEDLNISQFLEIPFPDKSVTPVLGVILTGLTYPNLLSALEEAGISFVLLGNNYGGPELRGDAVAFDGYRGAYDATRYLIDLGHSNILFVGDPGLSWFSGLYKGYLQAMNESDLKPVAQTKTLSDSFYSNGYLSVEVAFEQSNEITAIFAGYDETALGAWKALNDRGLTVPRDISLVGYDDEDYAAFTVPPLTTVRIDVDAIGRELISQLYKKLSEPSIKLPVVTLCTTLVKRGTCRPLKTISEATR